MTIITYACSSHPYVINPKGQQRHTVARPWAEVHASFGGKGPHRVWCLVDTGADEVILDMGTATALGLVPRQLPQRSVALGNGKTASYGLQAGVQLDFAGSSVTVPVMFGAVPVPLLGREALLNQSNNLVVGFDAGRWHHT